MGGGAAPRAAGLPAGTRAQQGELGAVLMILLPLTVKKNIINKWKAERQPLRLCRIAPK